MAELKVVVILVVLTEPVIFVAADTVVENPVKPSMLDADAHAAASAKVVLEGDQVMLGPGESSVR